MKCCLENSTWLPKNAIFSDDESHVKIQKMQDQREKKKVTNNLLHRNMITILCTIFQHIDTPLIYNLKIKVGS